MVYLFCKQFQVGRVIIPDIIYVWNCHPVFHSQKFDQAYHHSPPGSENFPHPHPHPPEVHLLISYALGYFLFQNHNFLKTEQDN